MTETNQVPKEDGQAQPTFLEQVKAEREMLEKVRDETRALLHENKELQAENILSGNTLAGKEPEKPQELSPEEYVTKLQSGALNVKE